MVFVTNPVGKHFEGRETAGKQDGVAVGGPAQELFVSQFVFRIHKVVAECLLDVFAHELVKFVLLERPDD